MTGGTGVRARAVGREVQVAGGARDMLRVAQLLVGSFYLDGQADGGGMNAGQQQGLAKEQSADMQRRYLAKNVQAEAAVLYLEDDATGDVVASVALGETPFLYGDALLSTRDLARPPPGAEFNPVLANLAVQKRYRKRGYGKRLVRECEGLAREWGHDYLWLLVEDGNVRVAGTACSALNTAPAQTNNRPKHVPTTQTKQINFWALDPCCISLTLL